MSQSDAISENRYAASSPRLPTTTTSHRSLKTYPVHNTEPSMVDGVGGPSRHGPEIWAGGETPYGEVRERRDGESAGSRGAALPRGFKESGSATARRPFPAGRAPAAPGQRARRSRR